MRSSYIPQMQPFFSQEEKDAVCNYMDENGFITEFKHTTEFENAIAGYTGTKHCIVVNSGTVSLTLAALACGVKAGDEVIVPNYTMIATPNSVQLFGAVPVFVDVEEDTLCLDIDKVAKAITPKTKAIMLVSANGRYPSSGIEAFIDLADKKGLVLIEDSAQSLGSYYPNGKHIGTAGRVGIFSFSSPKIISTGQGGALITDDDELNIKIRKLKDFGRTGGGNDIHDVIGYNFKFTELQACVGLAQIKKLKQRVIRKKEIFKKYAENLADLKQVKLFEHNLNHTTPWFIDALVEDRNNLIDYLKQKDIGTRVMYPPINKQLAYNTPGHFPVADLVGEKGLWLPSYIQLTDNEINTVCDVIKSYYS